jgi:hypothetical protein
MRFVKLLAAILSLVVLALQQLCAQVIYSDGFEGYNLGALDANLSGGPNAGPNGGPGNPWFGPGPPNLHVYNASVGVAPHSGTQLAGGSNLGFDFDQDWLNMAYRFNGGNPYFGSIGLNWWFYDPAGSAANAANYYDYVALGNYSLAGTTSDYVPSSGGNLNGGTVYQRLSLGAAPVTGYNSANYQVRVVGATDGLGGGQWFNVGTRSVGWHQAAIVLGANNGANTTVSFFVDGVDVLDHAITTTQGLNVIELNADFGSIQGYFDDFTLSSVPEPSTAALLLVGGAGAIVLRRRK